jgi:DUF971 family protein
MKQTAPIFIKAIKQNDRQRFTIEWSDGKIFTYRLSDIQRQCTCARCRDEQTGEMKIKPEVIDDQVEAKRIVSVGNYALQIYFTKGCSKGIYPFLMLRQLYSNDEK